MLDWLTHERIVLIYAISGILMAIGVYFTIRYRPYCTLKSPEKEEAMELHRKQILEEPMSEEEIEENAFYESMTKKYSYGEFILFISVPFHIFFGLGFFNLSPLYFLSVILLALVIVTTYVPTPYCSFYFPASLWSMRKAKNKHSLKYINSYLKKVDGEILTEDEEYLYRRTKNDVIFFVFCRNAINFGVLLHLTLDIWFALNGALVLR